MYNYWIEFQSDSSGCWSYIGDGTGGVGGQPINLGSGCVYKMVVEHEILHAMGIFHEQSRPDRDNFIIVHEENIEFSVGKYFLYFLLW